MRRLFYAQLLQPPVHDDSHVNLMQRLQSRTTDSNLSWILNPGATSFENRGPSLDAKILLKRVDN